MQNDKRFCRIPLPIFPPLGLVSLEIPALYTRRFIELVQRKTKNGVPPNDAQLRVGRKIPPLERAPVLTRTVPTDSGSLGMEGTK